MQGSIRLLRIEVFADRQACPVQLGGMSSVLASPVKVRNPRFNGCIHA